VAGKAEDRMKTGVQETESEVEIVESEQELYERALAAARELSTGTGRHSRIAEAGLEENVVTWLFQKNTLVTIQEKLHVLFHLDISIQAIWKFKAKVVAVLEVDHKLGGRIRELGRRLDLLEEIAWLYDKSKKRVGAVTDLEDVTLPTEIGNRVIEQHRKIIELYAKEAANALGMSGGVNGFLQAMDEAANGGTALVEFRAEIRRLDVETLDRLFEAAERRDKSS